MLMSEGRAATDRAERYLAQLCQHADRASHQGLHRHRQHGTAHPRVHVVRRTGTTGDLVFGETTCGIEATAEGLILRIQATDLASLQRVRAVVSARLERFGRRDGLTVAWTETPE